MVPRTWSTCRVLLAVFCAVITAHPASSQQCTDCCSLREIGFDFGTPSDCPITCTGGLQDGVCDDGCSLASSNGVYSSGGKTWYCNVDIDGGGWHLAYTVDPSDGHQMGWGGAYWTQTTDSHPVTDAVIDHDFVSADGAGMVRKKFSWFLYSIVPPPFFSFFLEFLTYILHSLLIKCLIDWTVLRVACERDHDRQRVRSRRHL